MIVHRTESRTLVCDCCGEALKVNDPVWNSPLAMRQLRRELERKHEQCKAFQGDPQRARAERIFREGMALHAAKLGE